MMGISFFRRPVGSAIEHFRPTFSAERKILQLSRYPFDGNDCRTPRPSLPSYSSRGCLSIPRRRDDASCCQHAISGNAPYHPPIGCFLHGVCSPFRLSPSNLSPPPESVRKVSTHLGPIRRGQVNLRPYRKNWCKKCCDVHK